jgi:hypothetical protein
MTTNKNIALETAKQHAEWQLQYGEMPAQLLYYRYLLPKLLEAGAARESQRIIRKAQELQVEILAKASNPLPWDQPESKMDPDSVHNVEFQGRQVKPGEAYVSHGNDFHRYVLLGHDASHLYGVKDEEDENGHNPTTDGWGPEHVVKIHRNTPDLQVKHYPQTLDTPLRVDSDTHGLSDFVKHPETKALAHGFDFGGPSEGGTGGITAKDSFWAKGPAGQHVYVKAASDMNGHESTEGPTNTARLEGTYHNLAKDFFGLGHYLPNVAVVRHPQTGREHAIVEHVPGHHARYYNPSDDPWSVNDWSQDETEALDSLGQSGDLHKLALMNHIMGNPDRHPQNWMFRQGGGLTLIDHNVFGRSATAHVSVPSYLRTKDAKAPVHPEALKWLKGLDAGELDNQLRRHGMSDLSIGGATHRLKELQAHAHLQKSLVNAMEASRLAPNRNESEANGWWEDF